MQGHRDHYELLGVPRDAALVQIQAAYRALAKRTHPDVAGDDPEAVERFRAASEACRVLSDPALRRRYDRGFDPVISVQDLFARHPAGRKVLETMLPSAPAAPRRGIDLAHTVRVDRAILEKGGSVDVMLPAGSNGEPRTIAIDIPPRATETPWCRIVQLGEPGKNGASSGDLILHFTTENQE